MFSFLIRFIFLLIPFWPFGGSGTTTREGPELKKTSLELPQNPKDFQFIRIALTKSVSEVAVLVASPYKVTDSKGRPLFSGERLNTKVKGIPEGIQIGPQIFHDSPLTIQTDGEGIKLDGRLYRHAVKIWKENSSKVSVINEVPIEDYLKGVLPWEANPEWPMEALKAQAIAARTYALFKAIENQDHRFALSKDVLSQVYGGKTSEKAVTSQAVEATRGQVLTYRGKIFPAYFHSTCGGATTQAETIWDVQPHEALKGVKCNFCTDSKHYRWSNEISRKEIETQLRKHGYKAIGFQEIQTADIDASGRAKNFMIILADDSKVKIRSNDFRLWVDPGKLKSTLIESIEKKTDRFIFRGRGWGHGVGLCQYGMKRLAELGYAYDLILQYYYPDTDITAFAKDG